ncbi:MAG: hypothetical protein RIS70_307 [Planctomycetota bacterium]|jgi:hypothetical protein
MNVNRRQCIQAIGTTLFGSSMIRGATGGIALALAADPVSPETTIPLGSRKALLVDRKFVADSLGTRLQLHPPKKTGERLIESEHPWESATINWFSILKDGDLYRMWYECYDVEGWPTADDTSFCYAESRDGIHWTKPKLGLYSYRGSTQNNILFRQIGEGTHRSRVHGNCVFIDPSAPPDARYKCISQGQFQGIADLPYFVAGMSSPDGLHWKRDPQPICRIFADSQYSGFWDDRTRQYSIFGRVPGRGGRAIGRSSAAQFAGFSPFARVLQSDDADPTEADLYNPACMRYPGETDLYVMFPSLFRHQQDTLEIRLAVSRDLETWTWPERETPLLGLGADGGFDSGSLYMGNGGCLRTGSEWSFYFSGSSLKHREVELNFLADPKNRRVISRAVASPDRLVSVVAHNDRGQFTTPPLEIRGTQLRLNAITATNGEIRVAILDRQGKPLPRYGLADCRKIQGDRNDHIAVWGESEKPLSQFDQPVRLQFELHNADLFSFQCVDGTS